MPSRRELIAMTPEEVREYLLAQQRIILISNGASGFPHPAPMNYGLDGQGRVLILTFAKSQKVRNLERDPRATLLVESGRVYQELKSVILYCRTEIIHPGPDFDAARDSFTTKAQTRTAQTPEMLEQIAESMKKRVCLRFTPERVISWDHAKLAGKY
ncbi:MAG: pyridoxamine 5'-phosphate oxidase family protein [Sphingomonadales bacterium]|nr:pyridoxamine 5'-phosphate oxidase family protein [Sphingomonadales bacterium]